MLQFVMFTVCLFGWIISSCYFGYKMYSIKQMFELKKNCLFMDLDGLLEDLDIQQKAGKKVTKSNIALLERIMNDYFGD